LLGLLGCNEPEPLVLDSKMNESLPSSEYLSVQSSFDFLKEGHTYGRDTVFGDFFVRIMPNDKTLYFRFAHKDDYKSIDGKKHNGSWFFDDNYEGIFFQVNSGPHWVLNRRDEFDRPREGSSCYKDKNSVGFRPVIENPEMSVLVRGLILASPDLLMGKEVEPNEKFKETYKSLKKNEERYRQEHRDKHY
jgi:hypothetical protein